MKVDEIRERFLRFFEERGHRIYPSDSLVPGNDPSLLFTGAGMNQFKDAFLGKVRDLKKAATCQKCLRTGDLENVGRTPDHHTFFEMLGNFSFGDYFKKEAIGWAWEFLTKELGLKEKDLWISVYKDDKEAYDIWRNTVKIREDRILKLGEKENFWPSNAPKDGPNGPCGPCSEIFYGGADGVEVWNLVFTQFDRKEGGKLEPLPNKNIDTGMGLERIARVLQGKKTNFEIDSFEPIVKEIERHAGRSPNINTVNAIADHIRAVTFAIGDGVLPSNEERGYVIRKLIRKAFWYGRNMGTKGQPFLYKIVPVVIKAMEKPYPELINQREDIAQVVLEEEKRFKNTIDEGTARAKEMIDRLKILRDEPKAAGVLSGEDAFKLYDTYGFPLELTQQIAEIDGIKVDVKGFEQQMENQRLKSRGSSKIEGAIFDSVSTEESVALKLEGIFIEDKEEIKTQVLEIISGNSVKNEIKAGEKAGVFLKETNFYGEKGGQIGDKGVLIKEGKIAAEVLDAVDVAGKIAHRVVMKEGVLKKGDRVTAKIDAARREAIRKNHTATHLLHSALRKVLGQHVKQGGSLVAPDRLRFDFTHFKALTEEEVSRVEQIVNENVKKNHGVGIDELPIEEARKKGAIALFGEKYGETVRMVSAGEESKELCGGTHVRKTGEIGIFKIVSESSIAAGMRRIEAITGETAYEKLKEEEDLLISVSRELGVMPADALSQVEKLTKRLHEMEKALEDFNNKSAERNVEKLIKDAFKIKDKDVIVAEVEGVDAISLRKNADLIKGRLDKGVFVLVSQRDGKFSMIVGLGKAMKDPGLDAVRMLNEIGDGFGVKGGGRSDFAQAGARSGPEMKEVLKKAKDVIEGIL